MTRGYSAPDVVETYGRALEICRQMGESPELLYALVGLYRYSLVRLELRTAKSLGERVWRLARRNPVPVVSLAGHLMRGVAAFGSGELAAARNHLEDALASCDPSQRRLIVASFGDDPGVIALADLAMTLWFLGYPEQALARSREAVAWAREAGIPYSLAFALNYSVWCRLLRGEGAAARGDSERLLEIAQENDFEYWSALGLALRGWVQIEQGEIAGGARSIEEGLAAYTVIGAELVRPWHLAKLADAYARIGRPKDAARAIEQALASLAPAEERFYEAEVHRLRGELILREGETARDRQSRAEACFRRAIRVARRQGARSLELRATLDLSRLWRAQGRDRAARQVLGRVFEAFQEGFDTADLRGARAQLRELGDAGL